MNSLLVPTKQLPANSPPAAKRRILFPVVLTLIAALLGGAGWYYFFGRKPKIAMTVAVEINGNTATRGLWSAGPNELLLVSDGDVELIDLSSRKKKWSVQFPTAPAPDPAPKTNAVPKVETPSKADAAPKTDAPKKTNAVPPAATVNARFVRLQQWADELSRKRTHLANETEIKAFNAEAAKYHAELTAARGELAKQQAAATPAKTAAPAPAAAVGATPGHVIGGDRSVVDALHPVVDPGVQILEDRMKKRGAKLAAWRTALDAKKANAKTPFQKSAVAEEEVRYAAEVAQQKKDEAASWTVSLSKSADIAEFADPDKDERAPAKANVQSATAAATGATAEPQVEATLADDIFGNEKPMAAICSDRFWIIGGRRAVAFDRASGAVKADVSISGRARKVFADGDTAIIVASAGAGAVQVTKLNATAKPQSLNISTGIGEPAFTWSGGSTTPNIQSLRTEFSAVAGSFVRVDIRLKEKKVRSRDAIKPGSEKELESAAAKAAAHSDDELKSVTALIRNDAARLSGNAVEQVDDSTYDITLSRPFETDAKPQTCTLKGRVQVFSTPALHLITAGTKLLAFDRTGKKAWEATLGSAVPIHRSDSGADGASHSLFETGGKLFFADGAFLTAFDAGSGQVAWRLPSVGIRKVTADGEGNLYVQSDNLHVETLTYSTDASLRDSTPVTMRVNPADGKVAWQVEKYQDVWASGKDVYALREAKNPGDVETQVFDPGKAVEARVKIYKLSRGNGSAMWEWFQPRRPHAVEVQGKNVALLFRDELQIIRSICW